MVMNCKKVKAFTLIELMTTTLIMGIIICAAIPFMMKKDIQKRAVAGHTGVFECYYDSNGQLKQHIRTKDGNESTTNVSGGTCTFNPNADYAKGAKNFQIVAIGAGGAGGTYNQQSGDGKFVDAIMAGVKDSDTLESSHIKLLKNHGRMSLGNLSNASGVNAWYWNGEAEKENKVCYRYYTSGCGNCGYKTPPYNSTKYCSCPNHFAAGSQFCEVTSRENKSSADYISVYDIGPRLCSLKHTSLMTKDLPEDDIFQAVHKYYGVAGSYTNGTSKGDVLYNIKAPSGLASCACLNDPVSGSRGSCMAGSIKPSVAGSAGVAYSFATYSGILRGAYMGNSFLTSNGSVDEAGLGTPSNHCASGLKLASTTFGCGTARSNNECSGQNLRTALNRGFPSIYHWGNAYHTGANPTQWYQKINMSYTNREGSLSDYGGDVHFRLITHSGGRGHAIVPSGAHGSNPTIAGGTSKVQTAASSVNSGFKGFINGHQGFYSANNPSEKCDSPTNQYINTAQNTLYTLGCQCSQSKCCASDSTGCISSGYAYDYKAETIYYGNNTSDRVCSDTDNCASCAKTNNLKTYTDSAGKCEHLNCCNDYELGNKQYTVRYKTGELVYQGSQRIERNFKPREHTLGCGDNLYIYRQIKNVPFERAFVASAGQNGAVRQASYPRINEQLVLQPGLGGRVIQTGGNVGANGQASIIKKTTGQIILTAQGGVKGASDKLNDTWVGPCMLFVHRNDFDVDNPGCIARYNVQRKPIYNSLLMANKDFLHTVNIKAGNNYKDMPGLGGDGAYANVFPDRFLLSKAIRNEVVLETNIVGPDQGDPWSKTEGVYKVKGLDIFKTKEFIGDGDFKEEFDERYSLLQQASNNFLNNTQLNGRVPNFVTAKDGNNGAIVIIW